MNGIEALRHSLDESKIRRMFIAEQSGVDNTTINKWLRGATSPTLVNLEAVINTCGFVMNTTLELPMGRSFWKPADKKKAIELYSKEFQTIGEIATEFDCTRDEVERMLKAEGQLL